ncbi:UNVERIFIED_CONTAM: hypothetical protein RMT77_000103 [Armadillidium vulgare]
MFGRESQKNYMADNVEKSMDNFYQVDIIQTVSCGMRIFHCPYCPYKSKHRESHVRTHIKYKHSGEKPYQCPICQKPFAENSNLKAHMRVHTGEKPFLCHICSESFAYNSRLKVHIMKSHS